jgi:tetraacyldisaccharide 4'-kinase
LLQRLFRALLILPAVCVALYRRLETKLHALKLCRTCRPAAATVSVGGMSPDSRGRVLLTSWLLGWAKARELSTAVIAPLGDGAPPVRPFQVLPGSAPRQSGIETALLSRYVPHGRILVDSDPCRAADAAIRSFAPDLLLLHDALADPRLVRDLELALLTPDDLARGFNRVFPAGHWRRDASVLARVSAFCIFAGPLELDSAMIAAKRRLERYGKPIFGMTFRIWRWRGPTEAVPTEDLVGEPYIAVLGESDRAVLPDLFHSMLNTSPRMAFFVHDRHRFTLQDFENLRNDADRLRVQNILTSPRLALKLRESGHALDGHAVWTYDPEVVFGPTLFCDVPFLSWWEAAFAATMKGRRPT